VSAHCNVLRMLFWTVASSLLRGWHENVVHEPVGPSAPRLKGKKQGHINNSFRML
jgi:hypothetical protein